MPPVSVRPLAPPIPARQVTSAEILHYREKKHAQDVRKFHVVRSFQLRPPRQSRVPRLAVHAADRAGRPSLAAAALRRDRGAAGGAAPVADFDQGSLQNFPFTRYIGTARWVKSHPKFGLTPGATAPYRIQNMIESEPGLIQEPRRTTVRFFPESTTLLLDAGLSFLGTGVICG